MEFFNRKENVIDIQMTSYGKHLLSMGKFKPAFYSFHDNDVIYNSKFGGFDELQSEAQGRIFETPRIKTQACFESAQTRIEKMTNMNHLDYNNSELFQYVDQSVLEDMALNLSDYQPTQTKYYSLGGRIGTSRLTSNFAPSWNVNFVEGSILNPQDNILYYTTASISTELIPQINIETPLLLDIQENNSDNNSPKFDLEVFEIKTDEKGSEYLSPIKFGFEPVYDSGGYYIGSNLIQGANENKKYVDYFLDISVDGEVQRSIDAPMPDLPDYDYSTPPFSVPPGPLSQIPVNDFACPDEIATNFQSPAGFDPNVDTNVANAALTEQGQTGGSGATTLPTSGGDIV